MEAAKDQITFMAEAARHADEVAATHPDEVHDFVRSLLLEQAIVNLHQSNEGFKYDGYASLILEHGLVAKASLDLPQDIEVMELQQCYRNSFELACEVDGLTYCEGYAVHSIIRVPHAWVVDPAGNIIDPTWTGLHERETHAYYAGIKFDTEFLVMHANETGYVSMLATDWERDCELLRLGLVMDGDVAIGIGEL